MVMRPIDYYLSELLAPHGHGNKPAASAALAAIGPEAVPELLAAAEQENFWDIPKALAAMGPVAIPQLRQALKQGTKAVRDCAARAFGFLAQQSPEVMPDFIEAIQAGFGLHNGGLHHQLMAIGSSASITVPALLNSVRGADPDDDRGGLERTISSIGPAVIPALVQGLKDSAPEVRACAAKSLERFSSCHWDRNPALIAAIPHFVEGLRDEYSTVRRSCFKTITSIGWYKLADLHPLQEALDDEEVEIRILAIGEMKRFNDTESFLPTIVRLVEDPDPRVRATVANKIGEMERFKDTESFLPTILRLLKDSDPNVRAAVASKIGTDGFLPRMFQGEQVETVVGALVAMLEDEAEEAEEAEEAGAAAASALGRLKSAPQESIPALLRACLKGDESTARSVAYSARMALESFGSAVQEMAPAFIEPLLQSPDSSERLKGVKLLHLSSDSGACSSPLTLRCLRDSDPLVRREALRLVGGGRSLPEELFEEVQGMLTDTNASVRERVVAVLARLAPSERRAAEALLTAVHDTNDDVRSEALDAIRELGKELSIPLFVTLLKQEDPTVRLDARRQLYRLGSEAILAARAILEQEPSVEQHPATQRALAESPSEEDLNTPGFPHFGPVNSASKRQPVSLDDRSLPDLVAELSTKPDARIFQAISKRGQEARIAIPVLVELLTSDSLREDAVGCLGRLGPDAADATPAIINAMRNLPFRKRMVFIHALPRIDPSINEHELLLDAIRFDFGTPIQHSEDSGDFERVVAILEEVGQTTVPILEEGLRSTIPIVRWRAAKGLGAIARAAGSALPGLITALKDPSRAVREEGATTIGRIGWGAAAAVPALCEALSDADSFARREVARALGRIGPDARMAVPALHIALSDSEEWVRDEAAWALEKIEGFGTAIPSIALVDNTNESEPAWMKRIERMERKKDMLQKEDPAILGHHLEESSLLSWKIHEERKRFKDRVTNAIAQGAELRFRKADDLRATILRDKQRASALLRRHNKLIRSPEIVRAILELERSGNVKPLTRLRRVIKEKGAFLDTYTLDRIEGRLPPSPVWVIAETEGKPPSRDDRHFHFRQPVWAGDCQCYLSPDKEGISLHSDYIRLPDPLQKDFFLQGREIADEIRTQPACAGCVADICAEDWVANLGFAGEARHAAFTRIKEINKSRKHPIRYMLAEIFSIKGINLPDGSTILLGDLGQPPLGNEGSIFAHVNSVRNPAVYGWMLVERNVRGARLPEVPSAEFELITDWVVMVHDLQFGRRANRP